MSIHLNYDKTKEILYCSFCDSFSLEELESTLYAITHSTEYAPDVKSSWNMEKLDHSAINEKVMKQLISIRQKYPQRRNAKVAIVAPSDLVFGLSRMYETFSEVNSMPQNIYVFRNQADADKWLLDE
ncbi:MAG: hypothetical protein PHP95_11815 [Desulfuromonadaceae bacterium]|nr:hypothetical protein [Desulfuromonadaceae bacterium]MDD2849132.1 hypothetical protein [Desulfuromonadaceae bacterium]MDD4129500.1 hypothetical protein [Desulfuromonadaceae bacterium]